MALLVASLCLVAMVLLPLLLCLVIPSIQEYHKVVTEAVLFLIIKALKAWALRCPLLAVMG